MTQPAATEADDPRFETPSATTRPPEGPSPELADAVRAWIADDPDEASRDELTALLTVASAAPDGDRQVPAAGVAAITSDAALAELQDRFAGHLQFGTAGLRGAMAAGPNRMNRAVVIRAAAGLAAYLRDVLPDATPRIVVGYDARHRSRHFALDTVGVMTAAGVEALLLPSALPTPVLAFAVRHLDADAGVMVTASHNPAADNGYKVYLGGRVVTDGGQGAQIVPPFDADIASRIDAVGSIAGVDVATSGWRVLGDDVLEAYVSAVVARSDGAPTRDLRVVTTAMHGVGGAVLADVLDRAGFRTVAVVDEQAAPDPDFPTVAFPNPEEPGAIELALGVAQDWDADVVIANDPDADRCAVAVWDHRYGTYRDKETATSQGWRMLHGDEVGALLGADAAGRVSAQAVDGAQPATFASSVVSSRVLGRIASAHGLRHVTTLTGFKWISRVEGLAFGYEEALGYCVAPANVRDKDGISAALAVVELAQRLKNAGRTLVDALDDVARAHGLFLTDQVSARYTDLSEIGHTMERLRTSPPARLGGAAVVGSFDLSEGWNGLPPTDGIGFLTADDSRVIVRPSGTEPKVKAYLEVVVPVSPQASDDQVGDRRATARKRLDHVAADVREVLGIAG
ncbi:phospho-sugar mutase [Luteimicrobium subarcticum]|uniref:Phosphomannomutase n=1 Tax=Luteimicrobium subarcticum TaxID=620910 RepID=A0A2M8WUJ7_9MICO|nr:phospho-sugar mutase [Luteimicrobium subarcticum]PJI94578.1 phosphomannomutase [Luteimicrobium subarcticum]